MERKILLHCCCGPCSTSSIMRLLEEGWSPILFFSNSNIYPEKEYFLRYDNLLKVAEKYNLRVIIDSYDHEEWREWVKGLETENEGGERCKKCFAFNLKRAYNKAQEEGIEHFTTTLTVSKFKNSALIFSVGENFPGFEKIDFKKKGGFEKSSKLSKELGLYRQQYCGCEFSMRSGNVQEVIQENI